MQAAVALVDAGSIPVHAILTLTFVLTVQVFAVVWAFVFENCVSGLPAQESILVLAVVCEAIVFLL